jgi:ATP-dependent HslUV protease ATP-binding subunit HslU
LLETEGVEVTFKEEGILAIATIAAEVNESIENIGARRLHTILEKLMEDISFRAGDGTITSVSIDSAYVDEHLKDLSKDRDLSRFIL